MKTRTILATVTMLLGLATGAYAADRSSPDSQAADQAADQPTAHLDHSGSFIPFDADFEGTTSAVAWRNYDEPDGRLRVSRSNDEALGDFTTQEVATDDGGHRVAVCGAAVVVVYSRSRSYAEHDLWLAYLPGDSGSAKHLLVRTPLGRQGPLDIACVADRAYLAWTEDLNGQWHALAQSVSLPGLQRSSLFDAGPAKRYHAAIAALDDGALLAWQAARRIELARLEVDTAQQLASSWTRTVAKRGREPILDADGARVALGYERGIPSFIATSRDGGVTFDRRHRFDRDTLGGAAREVESLAVLGDDIVATIVVHYGGDAQNRLRLRSRDFGETWATSPIGDPVAAIPQDGFLLTPNGIKVAEAYTDGVYANEYDLRVRRDE